MDEARIQILVPAYNNILELDETMKSIWEQDYNAENVYITIVDFGSEDGTYEKALKYDRKHLGVYRKTKQKNFRLQLSEAAGILSYVKPGGAFSFTLIVKPGEILYKNCIKVCVNTFIENYKYNPSMLICETDIKLKSGEVIHQIPLYEKDKIINGYTEFNEYICRGFNHQIIIMGYPLNQGRYKSNFDNNEQRFWNKTASMSNERNTLYIHEALAMTKEILYENEFEEIIYRWETIISISRFYMAKFEKEMNKDFELLAKKNLAEYALWRSYVSYRDSGDAKMTEDCFIISSVISRDVVQNKIYSYIKSLIYENDTSHLNEIYDYYYKYK